MPHDVFISYSSADARAAEQVRDAIERAGIGCWIAPRDALPGDKYQGSIIRAIRQCRAVVFLLSANSNRSEHVFRELHAASEAGRPIVPVRLDAVEPGDDLYYYLAPLHWLDAQTPPLERHIARLIEVLAPHVSGAGEQRPDPMRVNGHAPVRVNEEVAPQGPTEVVATPPAVRVRARVTRRIWGTAAAVVVIAVSAFSGLKLAQQGNAQLGEPEPGLLPPIHASHPDVQDRNPGAPTVGQGEPGAEPGPAEGGEQTRSRPADQKQTSSGAPAVPAASPGRTDTTAGRAPVRPPPVTPSNQDAAAEAQSAHRGTVLGGYIGVLSSNPPPADEKLAEIRAGAVGIYQADGVSHMHKHTAAYVLGQVSRLRGDLSECAVWLKRAVQLSPNDSLYRYTLTRCEQGS